MKIERLMLLSLQYLEKDADIDTTKFTIDDVKDNDIFSEYINNMEHSIQMGLMRLSSSLILPVQEVEVLGSKLIESKGVFKLQLKDTKESIAHKIAQVYKIKANGAFEGNIHYTVIGSKIIIRDKWMKADDTYFVIYHPRVFDLERYRDENENTYDIDLSCLSIEDEDLGEIIVNVPDEMAMTIKYLIYSDLKMEEEPSIANINKNYFESYLNENATTQIVGHEIETKGMNWNETGNIDYNFDPLNMGDDDD